MGRVDGPFSDTTFVSVPIETFETFETYIVEFELIGDQLSSRVSTADGATLLAEATASDSAYVSGVVGLSADADVQDLPLLGVFDDVSATTPISLISDLNGDGTVDALDAGILFENWGEVPPGDAAADLNGDSVIDAADAGVLFQEWTGDTVASVPEPMVTGAMILLLAVCKRIPRRPQTC